jgi:hypothetical protein
MSDIPTESGGTPVSTFATEYIPHEEGGAPVFVVEHDVPAPPPARFGCVSVLTATARGTLEPLTAGSAVVVPAADAHCWLRAARKLGKKTASRALKGSVPPQTRIHII